METFFSVNQRKLLKWKESRRRHFLQQTIGMGRIAYQMFYLIYFLQYFIFYALITPNL